VTEVLPGSYFWVVQDETLSKAINVSMDKQAAEDDLRFNIAELFFDNTTDIIKPAYTF